MAEVSLKHRRMRTPDISHPEDPESINIGDTNLISPNKASDDDEGYRESDEAVS